MATHPQGLPGGPAATGTERGTGAAELLRAQPSKQPWGQAQQHSPADLLGSLGQAAAGGQQQGHRQLSRGVGQHVRGVAHADPPAGQTGLWAAPSPGTSLGVPLLPLPFPSAPSAALGRGDPAGIRQRSGAGSTRAYESQNLGPAGCGLCWGRAPERGEGILEGRNCGGVRACPVTAF